MAIDVADGTLEYMAEDSGAIALHVDADADAADLERGLSFAAARIAAIRHPEEPTEQYASFIRFDGSELYADMHDAEAYDGILEATLDALVDGLSDAGIHTAVIRAGVATLSATAAPTPASPIAPPMRRRGLSFLVASEGELVRLSDAGVEHLPTAHAIEGIGGAGDQVVVSAQRSPSGDHERFARLWALDNEGNLAPLAGIGSPPCGAFAGTPAGDLFWTDGPSLRSEGQYARLLYANLARREAPRVLVDTAVARRWQPNPDPHDDIDRDSVFLGSPTQDNRGRLALLAGGSLAGHPYQVLILTPEGESTALPAPPGYELTGLAFCRDGVLACAMLGRAGLPTIAFLDESGSQVGSLVTGWHLGMWSHAAETLFVRRSHYVNERNGFRTDIAIVEPEGQHDPELVSSLERGVSSMIDIPAAGGASATGSRYEFDPIEV